MKIQPEHILISDYTYPLPQEKIAAFPLPNRDESRLLFYDRGQIKDEAFKNLPGLLTGNSTLVFNDTRVIAARMFFQKPTGGVIELFCLEPFQKPIEPALHDQGSSTWECMIGGASKWKPGLVLSKQLQINGKEVVLHARFGGKVEESFIIHFDWSPESFQFSQVIHAAGAVPLPPYIKRSAAVVDEERYQTVFSTHEGSVAAPTAALHFSRRVLDELEQRKIRKTFVTLHVGAGTFKPVKSETIAGHHMHGEVFSVNKKSLEALLSAKNIIAVGTTSLRTIESLHWMGVKLLTGDADEEWNLGQWACYGYDQTKTYQESYSAILQKMHAEGVDEIHCRTSLIIVPGYRFKVAKELITNFHQPQSTLLLLVAAFVGEDWKKVYQHALENDYRFLSYGDSSYLRPAATLS